MKSVDALRKWADGLRCVWIDPNDHSIFVTTCDDMPPSIDCVNLREHVNAILDAIEREVEELRDRDYRNGREDAEGAVEFADRLKASATNRADVTLFGVDYTALPLDADGVPIHVGDVMEWDNGTFTVHELKVTEDGWTTWDEQHGYTVHADETHHHAPTVEDVLREFFVYAERGKEHHSEDVDDAVLAQYAARLRLAGDE